MQCPRCGFQMDAFTVDCPRCKKLTAEGAQTPPRSSPVTQQASPPLPPSNAGKVVAIVFLCLLGFCVLTGIIASLAGSGDGKRESTQRTDTHSDGPMASTPNTWVEVTRLDGNGNKRSAPFRLDRGKKRLNYTVSNDNMAVCMVYVVKDGTDLETTGGFPEVSCSTPGTTDTTYLVKPAGNYYLEISAANCSWSVIIEEER